MVGQFRGRRDAEEPTSRAKDTVSDFASVFRDEKYSIRNRIHSGNLHIDVVGQGLELELSNGISKSRSRFYFDLDSTQLKVFGQDPLGLFEMLAKDATKYYKTLTTAFSENGQVLTATEAYRLDISVGNGSTGHAREIGKVVEFVAGVEKISSQDAYQRARAFILGGIPVLYLDSREHTDGEKEAVVGDKIRKVEMLDVIKYNIENSSERDEVVISNIRGTAVFTPLNGRIFFKLDAQLELGL